MDMYFVSQVCKVVLDLSYGAIICDLSARQ